MYKRNTFKRVLLTVCVILICLVLYPQDTSYRMTPHLNDRISLEDGEKRINEFRFPKLSVNHFQRNKQIPKTINNSHEVYYPWPFYQTGLECGQSTTITQILNYEICFQRGWTDINYNLDHKFPAHFVWNFCNDGINQGVLFLESWKVAQSAGTPNFTDWGGYPQEGQHRKWLTGYDKYYRSMGNRISEVCVIPTDSEIGILTLKHWLYNHIENKQIGGLASFNATFKYPDQIIPMGLPDAGKSIITHFTNDPHHAYTIIGYNDTVGWDYNQDHQLTNHLDINGDGVVNLQDWELGCFIISHTSGPSWGDFGQTYLPYRLMSISYHDGGIWGTSAYVAKVKEEVKPQLTAKIDLTYNKRGRIKLYFGVSNDTTALYPSSTYKPYVFDYQGGDFYMTGGDAENDKTIEIGVDISYLLNYISPNTPTQFFLLIDEQDPDHSGNGQVNQFSIIHYNGDVQIEIVNNEDHKPIVQNGTTSLSLIYSVEFSKPEILNTTIECTLNEPFEKQLSATGGVPNYRWELSKGYQTENISNQFHSGVSKLTFSDPDTGFIKIDLPFTFPFYGEDCNVIYLSADGFISFAAHDFYPFVYSNQIKFETTRMIAPFFSDLTGINATKTYLDNSLIITYYGKIKGQPFSTISFSVHLFHDGTIELFFNKMGFSKTPYISGISDGNIQNVMYHEFSNVTASEISQKAVRFKPLSNLKTIFLSTDGVLTGFLNYNTTDSILVNCYDNNDILIQKWIMLDCKTPDHITVTHSVLSESGSHTIQKWGFDNLNLTVQNFGDSVYQNVKILFQCVSPYLTPDQNLIEMGTFTAQEIKTLNQIVRIDPTNHAPEDYPIDIHWFIITGNDTMSKGLFTFYVKTPDIEVVKHEFMTLSQTENKVEFQIKNLNNFNINTLRFELISNNELITISSENTVFEIEKNRTISVPFTIHDPELKFVNSNQPFVLQVFGHDHLIQSKMIGFVPCFYYSVYPNPTNNYLVITPSDPELKIVEATIYNISGIKLESISFHSYPYIADVSDLKQGLYFIKLKSENQIVKTLKIIKL